MYRETAFERDCLDSNENAPRVYLQRPLSQAEADVADLDTTIIMSHPRRSCTEQTESYVAPRYCPFEDSDEERCEGSEEQSSVGKARHLTESFEFDDDQDDEQGPPIKRRRTNTPRLRIPLTSNVWAEIFGLTFEHQALPDSFDQLLFLQEIISVAFHILEKDDRIDIHAILDAAHGPL